MFGGRCWTVGLLRSEYDDVLLRYWRRGNVQRCLCKWRHSCVWKRLAVRLPYCHKRKMLQGSFFDGGIVLWQGFERGDAVGDMLDDGDLFNRNGTYGGDGVCGRDGVLLLFNWYWNGNIDGFFLYWVAECGDCALRAFM